MDPQPGDPVEVFATRAALERWMAKHHKTTRVLWIKTPKKGSGLRSVTYDEAVDVALAHGWIDGQSKTLDATYYLQRYTPRGPRSRWSKLNRERIARLTSQRRMRPAGIAEVERAKADGRWDAAYDPPSTATVPADLARALAAEPKAKAFFATLNGTNRYAILHRLQQAKKPETRSRRISTFIAMLRAGKTLY